MKSILQASRIILAINLIAYSSGVRYAATGGAPAPFKRPLINWGRVKTMKPSVQARIKSAYPQLPLYFEANGGQADASVKFTARGPGYRLFLTSSEATLVLQQEKKASSNGGNTIQIHLKGSNPHPFLEGQDLLPGKSNYFIGIDSKKWHSDVAHYSKVAYRQVYPGIDMLYAGDPQQLEYSFIVAPGASTDLIRMNFM